MDDYVKDQILKFFSFYFKNIEKSGYKVYQKNELEIRF